MPPPSGPSLSPTRGKFLQRITSLSIKPTAREYYVRWAESWTKAHGHQSAERTQAYFDALGRSTHVADWQFRQAVDAARILACDVLAIPWASSFDWQGLSDQGPILAAGPQDARPRDDPCGWSLPAPVRYRSVSLRRS